MERNERLEELSDLVRKGIPIGFDEAIEVIAYQEKLKKEQKGGLWSFIKKIFNF